MTRIMFLTAFLFFGVSTNNFGLDCVIPENSMGMFKNALAWHVYWYGEDYLNNPDLELKVVQRDNQGFWYLVNAETFLYQDYETKGARWSFAIKCPIAMWLDCMKKQVHNRLTSIEQPNLTDLLLGLPGSTRSTKDPLRVDEICSLLIMANSFESWHPSSKSILKDNAVKAITKEVTKQSSFFGMPINGVCNDFNIDDPQVFSFVDITHTDGSPGKLFITMEFNGRSGNCATKHIDTIDFPENLVKKVRQMPISLALTDTGK